MGGLDEMGWGMGMGDVFIDISVCLSTIYLAV